MRSDPDDFLFIHPARVVVTVFSDIILTTGIQQKRGCSESHLLHAAEARRGKAAEVPLPKVFRCETLQGHLRFPFRRILTYLACRVTREDKSPNRVLKKAIWPRIKTDKTEAC